MASLYADLGGHDADADASLAVDDDDPYQLVTAAVSLPANSPEQAEALLAAGSALEAQPTFIEQICPALLDNMVGVPESMIKVWVVEMIAVGLGRATLSMEARAALSEKILVSMNTLLRDPSTVIVKLAIRCFSSMLSLLFRQICVTRPPPVQLHALLTQAKHTILALALHTTAYPLPPGVAVGQAQRPGRANAGVRALAWKFAARVMLISTRGGSSDPRMQSKNDPNLNLCPADHPLIRPDELTAELTLLIEQLVTLFYQEDDPAILHPLINLIPPLVKARPLLSAAFLPALATWTPNNMSKKGRSFIQIKAVEKTLKVVMVHLLRSGQNAAYRAQFQDAMSHQAERISKALQADKLARTNRAAAGDLKRLPPAESSVAAAKRARVRSPSPSSARPAAVAAAVVVDDGVGAGSGDARGIEFDATALEAGTVMDLLMATLDQVDAAKLGRACNRMRALAQAEPTPVRNVMLSILGPPVAPVISVPLPAPSAPQPMAGPSYSGVQDIGPRQPETDDMLLDPDNDETNIANAVAAQASIDEGPVKAEDDDAPVADPLTMLEDDDEYGGSDVAADEAASPGGGDDVQMDEVVQLRFLEFKLPPPIPLDDTQRQTLMLTALKRICISGQDVQGTLAATDLVQEDEVEGNSDSAHVGTILSPKEMWILLLSRLPSRGMSDAAQEGEEAKTMGSLSEKARKAVCDFIATDFVNRSKLAVVWLNEEWFNEQLAKDDQKATYSGWLRTLLHSYIGKMDSADKSLTRFLLDLPEISQETVDALRDMCLVTDRAITGFTTLREIVNMRPPVRPIALQTLLDLTTHADRKVRLVAINTVKRWVPDIQPLGRSVVQYALQMVRRLAQGEEDQAKDENMEEGEEKEEKAISTYLPERPEYPLAREMVQQHVELLFALCVRDADLLDEIFNVYPHVDPSVQEAIGILLTPLIRSLGPTNAKLLGILRNFPAAAEGLALRVLSILTESGKPGPGIVALVKALMIERDLDAKFLIPIAGDMDKAELQRYLPKIFRILCGKAAEKDMVRTVIRHVVSPPVDLSLSTNVVREKKDDVSPADMLVMLHDQEKEIGLKPAMEAIDLCFGLTDLFPSEVFAVFMQRIIDGTTLPTLFMRTVIRAVSSYKSLAGFISTTLFSRLITKKIWTNPQLWKGFMHCAKVIAPASFGALLQLPKDQLRDMLENQPSIKASLWQFVVIKAGPAKMNSIADLFGDIAQTPPLQPPQMAQAITTMS